MDKVRPHTYFDTPMKIQLHEALPEIRKYTCISYDTGTRDVGPCTFRPFFRCRHSKTNCHSRKLISHYSFWNFRSKTKSGSQVPLSVLVPKSKSRSWSSLLVLELVLPIRKAESFFHYLFWNFRSHNERRNGGG